MGKLKEYDAYKWTSVTGLDLLKIPRAAPGVEPFEVDDEWLEEITTGSYEDEPRIGIYPSVFKFFGEGSPEEVTAMELEGGAWLIVANNSRAFTDTFHEPERIEVRYWLLTERET